MIDWSKPIQTVDGKKARLLGELKTLHTENDNKVVAVELPTGYECVYTYYANGRSFLHKEDHTRDIINVPPRKVTHEVEAWAVVDRDGTMLGHYGTRESANESWVSKNKGARVVRLTGTVEVEVEE